MLEEAHALTLETGLPDDHPDVMTSRNNLEKIREAMDTHDLKKVV